MHQSIQSGSRRFSSAVRSWNRATGRLTTTRRCPGDTGYSVVNDDKEFILRHDQFGLELFKPRHPSTPIQSLQLCWNPRFNAICH